MSLCVEANLVSMQSVDESSLQQVQDLHGVVTRSTDQVFVGGVEGETIDRCTVDWFKEEEDDDDDEKLRSLVMTKCKTWCNNFQM